MTSEPLPPTEIRLVPAVNGSGSLVIQAGDRDPWVMMCRASLHPVDGHEHLWHLGNMVTTAGFERRGWGELLLQAVRDWAAQHGHTVRTAGAVNDAYVFYDKTGCRWDPDLEEYVVAEPRQP